MTTPIQDDEAFWQDVEHLAYALDGERAESMQDRIEHFLKHCRCPHPGGSIEDFRRYSVIHLLHSFRGLLANVTRLPPWLAKALCKPGGVEFHEAEPAGSKPRDPDDDDDLPF
jgi:hypothetical protein